MEGKGLRTVRPIAALIVILCGGSWLGCFGHQPPAVSPEKARQIRVAVLDGGQFTATDDDCPLHYEAFGKSLPAAVRAKLLARGFTVVGNPRMPHDLDAVISGHFTYCKESGSCINGVATVEFYQAGVLVEHYKFDTGDQKCISAPTVGEYPERFAAELGDHLVSSKNLASLAVQPAGVPLPTYPTPQPVPPPQPVIAPPPAVVQTGRAALAPVARRYAQGAPQPNAYAFVVGIEKYRDVPSPTGARADAQGFAALAMWTLGISRENIRMLLDDRATRGDMEKQLAWLETNVPSGGRIYFFYSGHGAPDPVRGTPYLVPYDGDPSALEQTAISLATVTQRLSKTRAVESIAFVDACFSGAGGRSVLPPGARPLVRVQAAPAAPKLFLLSSSSGAEISGSAPDGSGGLFTKYLIEGIGDAQADLDGDRQISLGELKSWIEPRVVREAKRANRNQTPTLTIAEGRDAASVIVAFGVHRN